MRTSITGLALLALSAFSNSSDAGVLTGLRHYWDFDHSSGFVLDDSAGSNDGTLQGYVTPTWQSGRFGNALSFDGTNDQVSLGNFNISSNQVSVGGWVRLNSLPSNQSPPFGGIFDSTADSFVLYTDQGNQELRFKVTDLESDAARPGIPESSLATSSWIHVLGVYDGTNNQASVYVNGALADQHTGADNSSGPISSNVRPNQFAFFGSQGGQYYLAGAIDDFGVWDRVLTPSEISALQTSSIGQLSSSAVPEPSTTAVLLGGLFVLWKRGRRQILRSRT